MMAEEPILAGAEKATEADTFLVVMELMVGVPGVKMPALVITRLPVPLCDTATNIPLPKATPYQLLLPAAEAYFVQSIPLGLVITVLVVTPPAATATKYPLP